MQSDRAFPVVVKGHCGSFNITLSICRSCGTVHQLDYAHGAVVVIVPPCENDCAFLRENTEQERQLERHDQAMQLALRRGWGCFDLDCKDGCNDGI